jgi:ureidoacrylate peracid hydrolase
MSHALMVIDMQNGFCHPQGSLPSLGMGLADVDRAVEGTVRAVARARAAGMPVVFTRHLYRPERADEGRNLAASCPDLARVGGLAAGSWDADVIDELGCGPDDLVVDKARFDAFLWTSLDPLLRGLGATDLIFTGVVTNVCVESTVRSAFMRDYGVTVLGDCCAARTPRLHGIALEALEEYGFCTVSTVDERFPAPGDRLAPVGGPARAGAM